MLIEVQCQHVTGYDAATGRNQICGQQVTVGSDRIGDTIPCPRCQQPIEIVAPQSRKTARRPAQTAAAATRKKSGNAGPAKRPTSAPNRPAPKAGNPSAGKKPTSAARRPAASSVIGELDEAPLDSQIAGGVGTRCSKCGHPAPYGRCTHCRHVESRFAKLHAPLEKIRIQPVGLQRWFFQTLSEGFPLPILILVSHAAVAIPSLMLVVLAIFSIAGQMFGTTTGIILLTVVLTLDLFYAALVYKGYQFLRNPKARLAWYQRPFWNFLLLLARLFHWEAYDQRLKGRRVIRVRDREFTDYDLGQLEGIRTVQVLDLEGTGITDRSVASMYRLEHLQCLVVRRTQVSHEAVFRLQQTFPHLWIWH